MISKRLRLLLIGLLIGCALIFIITIFASLSILQNKSRQVIDLRLQSRTTETQLANLEQAKKQVEKYSYFKQIAKTVVPGDKDQAHAVVDIFNLANASGISIASITFPVSTLGAKSTSGTSENAKTATPSTVLSQAKPVDGIAGLYSIALTIAPATGTQVPDDKQVTYPKLLDFLGRIERNRRTAQITQVNVQSQDTDTSRFISFNLTINIFIKP